MIRIIEPCLLTVRVLVRRNERIRIVENCSAPADKGKQKALDKKRPIGGKTLASIKCFKCGVPDHRANNCKIF